MPLVESGPLRFVPPKDFAACTAVTLGGARDDSASDPHKIFMKLRGNWGRASAYQLKRVLADSEGGNSHLRRDRGPDNKTQKPKKRQAPKIRTRKPTHCADSQGEFIGVFATIVREMSWKTSGEEVAQKSQMV